MTDAHTDLPPADPDGDRAAAEGLALLEQALAVEPPGGSLLERGEVPRCFDGLRLDSLVARGGMSEVYRGTQLELGRPVAVKLRLAPSIDSAFADALLDREARLLAGLDHPGLVPVHTAGLVAGRRYLVMDLLEGADLQDLQQTGLGVDATLAIAEGVAAALAAVHERGVAHRDLKPGNVFVVDGTDDLATRVRVLDLGIAGAPGGDPDEAGLGTRRFMAPEQRDRRPAGPAADVFALAVLLERLLDRAWTDLPASVRALHRRMRRHAPRQRPGMDTVLATLRQARRPEPRRHRLALLVVVLSLGLGGLLTALTTPSPAEPAPPIDTAAPPGMVEQAAPAERAALMRRLRELRMRLERASRGGPPLTAAEAALLEAHVPDMPLVFRDRVRQLLAAVGHAATPAR